MRFRIFLFLLAIFHTVESEAQLNPTQIRYTAWDIHALRYFPFKVQADSIVEKTMETIQMSRPNEFSRTSVDFVIDKDFFRDLTNYSENANNRIYKFLIKPYVLWMDYAHPFSGNNQILNLALFDSFRHFEQSEKSFEPVNFFNQGISRFARNDGKALFDVFGIDNIEYFIKENLGTVNLWEPKNETFLHSVKTPLDPDSFEDYHFFLSALEEMDSVPCYEIVFFSKEKKSNAYEGYLYISRRDYSLVKAIFTLNNSLDKRRMEEILFIQTPDRIETRAFLGDDVRGSLLLSQTRMLSDDEIPVPELTPAQKDFGLLQKKADNTRAYRNAQIGAYFLLTEHLPGKYFNFGPVFQAISYNKMEGLRLRAGGNTSGRFSRKIQLGGYLAYGIKDESWKYRGDVLYALTPKDRLSFSYVSDLNIPGFDLLTSRRDNVFYSFAHSATDNMSLQKIGYLNYEKELPGYFTLQVGGKYLSDRPQGNVQYFRRNGDTSEIIPELNTSEVHFGLRYAPNEKFIRLGNRKIDFRSPDLIIDVNHRMGIKNLFRSDYAYHITDFSAYKKMTLADAGSIFLRVSGGKVWDKVPFPLLFIPAGNQSYIYTSSGYNQMKFYEFITDRYVAGNLNIEFNWSPFDLFMNSSVRTGMGIRTIYGPLSDRNNPDLQPGLFVFNHGIKALGERPYTEVNIGLINLLKVFRVEYVYRLNYDRKGSLFLTSSYLF